MRVFFLWRKKKKIRRCISICSSFLSRRNNWDLILNTSHFLSYGTSPGAQNDALIQRQLPFFDTFSEHGTKRLFQCSIYWEREREREREREKQTQRQRETFSCIDGHRTMCFFSSFLSRALHFLFVPTYRWLISTKCCLHFFEPIPHRQCKWAESSASFQQHHANVRYSSSYWRGWRRMAYVFVFVATIVHTCFIQIPYNPFQPALHISRIWSFYTNVQWVWFIWKELSANDDWTVKCFKFK